MTVTNPSAHGPGIGARSLHGIAMCALLLGLSANALEPLQPITVRPAGVLGRQGNRDVSMSRQAISADGRFVVFSTASNNLVPDELGRVQDVFVVDTDTGELTAISRRPDGGEANGDSRDAVISGDGRWVAFTSTATDLVAQTADSPAVYLHDRATGVTRVLSATTMPGGRGSRDPSISHDGGRVVFLSSSPLLGPDDDGVDYNYDAYLYQSSDASLRRFEVDAGAGVARTAFEGAIAADGRHVALQVRDLGLAVMDLQDDSVDLVQPWNGDNYNTRSPSISANGSVLAFESRNALLSFDSNEVDDVYVFDRASRQLELASVSSSGAIANRTSRSGAISADGLQVAFSSYATNLHPAATGNLEYFLRSRDAQTTSRLTQPVSIDVPPAAYAFGDCCSISDVPRRIAFTSNLSSLVKGDSNRRTDAFVVDPATRMIERTGLALEPIVGGATTQRRTIDPMRPLASEQGRRVLFHHGTDNLVALPWSTWLFVRDEDGPRYSNPIHLALPADANAAVELPLALSDDGNSILFRRVPFTGLPILIEPPAPRATPRDLWLQSVYYSGRVDTSPLLPPQPISGLVRMSGDATRVVWVAAGFGASSHRGVYLFEARTRTTRRIDTNTQEIPGDASTSYMLGLSRNGRYAVFGSSAPGLVADDVDANVDLFLRNLDTWELTRLLHPATGAALSGPPSPGDIGVSDDGRIVVFASYSDDSSEGARLFRFDRALGHVAEVQREPGHRAGIASSHSLTLSADGRRLAYTSGSHDEFNQIWVHDAGQPSSTLVSRDATGAPANHDSISPYLTGSGDTLVFASMATNLDGPPHPVGDGDIYLQRLPTIALFRSGFE